MLVRHGQLACVPARWRSPAHPPLRALVVVPNADRKDGTPFWNLLTSE